MTRGIDWQERLLKTAIILGIAALLVAAGMTFLWLGGTD
jgi:hypothetical protein